MSRRTLALGVLGLGLSAAITVGGTLGASAAPGGISRTPSAEAASAGITAAGGGYAGWSAHTAAAERSHRTLSPNVGNLTPMSTSGTTVPGIDVSSYNAPVSWGTQWKAGKRFVYIKATEGTSYLNPDFSTQYALSYNHGFIRGAYHFARPDGASGADQAKYFVAHGGRWSADGRTLPGALDLEQNYTDSKHPCWGNADSFNIDWTKRFLREYKTLTGRDAVIYTNMTFWQQCMGNTTAFKNTNPLWFASVGTPSSVPGSWPFYTFLQYGVTDGMDQDRFSASASRLKALALNN